MKIVVCGSRDFTDYNTVEKAIRAYMVDVSPKDLMIISGGANGADALAKQYARKCGCGYILK